MKSLKTRAEVLAIDPGAKPGFAWRENGIINVALKHPGGVFDLAVCESQYWSGKKKDGSNKTSPKSMMTLSRTAGWQLGQTRASLYGWWLPKEWKNVLFRSGVKLEKSVFCKRVYRRFLDDRLRAIIDSMPKTRRPDALDAIGILLAYEKDPSSLVWCEPLC